MRTPLVFVAALTLAALPTGGRGQAARDGAGARVEQQAREAQRDRLRGDAAELRAEVERLRSELVQLGTAQAAGEREVGGKRSRLDQLNAQESELRARMSRTRAEQTRLLGALQNYQRHPPPALVVSPGSAKDAVRAAILMRAVAPELERRARAFDGEAQDMSRVRRRAASAASALFEAESAVADRRGRIEQLIAGKSALERSLLLDADQADADARRLAARAASLGDLIGAVRGRGAPVAVAAAPRLAPPVEGDLVVRFGEAAAAGRSRGLTWRTDARAMVRSPAAATVRYAGPLKGHGVVLILRSGGAYDIVLAGLQSAAPPPGGRVAAGEPIGRMANTRRPGPELYLEVRRNGEPIDPARLLRSAPASVAARPDGLRGPIRPAG